MRLNACLKLITDRADQICLKLKLITSERKATQRNKYMFIAHQKKPLKKALEVTEDYQNKKKYLNASSCNL